ncbi:target of Nesh-SH3 isoform X5 [Hyla sarda]|uniref:target of Nesh-SH3 isoform X5 n=1 Tax=Hyla sarda TaxID=327740 RepID=UPI0024C31A29|nr:target of Nesh-SH3 isoform X5 [Hyla sarda]
MVSRLSLLLFCGIIGAHLGDAQKLPKVKKLNMKAYINVTGDTLIMRFHRPNQNIKLEGFILGYGSNYFSNQYIQWPDNGKSYITDVDAETRYLIAVKPNDNPKKSCKEKNSFQKPLQLVIGTLSPTSVFLSWGILINPQVDWSALNKCPNDRFYTVRYREKNKDWLFQLCPTTETVIENLKPNTVYEFGVKDNSEDEIWSKPQTHKTSPKGKENGNIENNYKIPKGTLQYATEDTKAFVPVTKVKQGFHNLTKSTPPPTGKSPVYRGEIKKPYVATTTTRIATPKPKPVTKSTEAPPVSKPSEKPAVEHPKPAVSSQPVVKSFTPDSSTGTLEWVRATMVTHPFFQVTKIPIESSARDEPTASLVVVKESDGTQDESADMAPLEPILTMDPSRDKLVSPTITLFPYSKEIPSHQQEKALANERLATYMPQDTTVPQFIPGHPLATGVPQVSPLSPIKKYMTTLATTRQIIPAVQSNLPSPTRTQATTGKLAFTEVQHSPTLYGSIARTEGPYSVSVLTGGQHIPTSYESIARTEAPQSVSATSVQQRTRPPRTQTKTTKVFTGGQHIPSTYESIARTEAPQFVSATATQMSPVQQRTRSTRTQIKTTTAFTGRQHIPSTYESITRTEAPHSVSVTTTQMSPIQQRTRPPRTQTTATMGGQHVYTTHESIARTEAPHSVSAVTTQIIPAKQRTLPSHPRTKVTTVPNETASFHPKPLPSTEGQNAEADSKQPGSEISRTEAPHAYEEENVTLASQDKTVVQKFSSTSKPKTTTVHKTTSRPFTTISSTTSQWTQSTQASKKATVSPVQHKTPLPKKTHPTAVLKDIDPTQLLEETTTTMAQTKTQKLIPKKAHTTELPSFPVDPRTTHSLPTDDLGYDIFEHSKIPLEANKTEKASSPKFNRTTKSPTISTVIKPVHTKKMPINLISLQIFADPTLPSEKTETQTISPPIPKTTQSNKILYSKPAPKSTQRVPINFISLQIFEEPDAPLVPNTTQRLYQPTTTQKPESPPQTKPVPTQKVSSQTTKKPKPTRRTKPAPYRLQHNSSRPKTSLRPRTRPPATNGTTQGPVRSRPNGEFNWQPGTIPGGRVHDTTTRILGATRNTSMESNNTGKRTFSVSSPPLPPVRPTYIRRRIQPSNVTGRPGVSVSSPPHLPVKPTTIRRKPPSANETGRPGNQGGILIPRASSATKPECAVACIKSPTKQPTLPAQEEDLVYSTVFSPSPKSDIDALGKTRYTAPHVVYMSKNDSVPCSITDTLQHFSTEEENLNQEITSAPQNPPTNLTVVTVEGCSSFVVIQWDKPNNDTVTEYNLISKENGGVPGKDESIITTNQTHSTVENLKPDTSYEFKVIPINPLGEGPGSATVGFNTESADPRVSEPVTGGKDAIWTEIKFKADSYSECRGKQYVKRTWYKKFVGIQLCNSLRYKIYLSDTLSGTFYNIGDQSGFGEDHCQFVDSFLEGRTGQQLQPNELEPKKGFYRAVRQQPVDFGDIGGSSHISYVHWYECGKSIPGKW